MANIEESIKTIISEQLGWENRALESDDNLVEHLGGDSLDTVEIIMAIEEEFNIEISDRESNILITVGDFINHVERKVG